MTKRKRIEAWAVFGVELGEQTVNVFHSRASARAFAREDGHRDRVVRLVEADPTEAAVVRAAVRWWNHGSDTCPASASQELLAAVERLKGKK